MLCPGAKTHPTELMLASLTGHVVTTLVLLDCFGTTWTRFGVGHDPGHVLTLVLILLIPVLHLTAVTWSVSLLATLETELLAAFTHDLNA